MKDDLVGKDPCPLCGALPCDWVDDPHKVEVGTVISAQLVAKDDLVARLREPNGTGENALGYHPYINPDGPEAAARIASLEAEVARLREALGWYAQPHIYEPHPLGPAFDRRDLSWHAVSVLSAALKRETDNG